MHRKIECKIWANNHFLATSDDAKLVWFHMYTNQYSTGLGIYRMPIPGLAADFGWSFKRYDAAVRELAGNYDKKQKVKPSPKPSPDGSEKRFVLICPDTNTIYFPRFLKYNKPNNGNVLKSLLKTLKFIPEGPVKAAFIQDLKQYAKQWGENFANQLDMVSASLSHQEQEQEQEQDSNISSSSPGKVTTNEKVIEVFEHWKATFEKKRVTLTAERRTKIAARLKQGFTVEYLKLAIDGCKSSDFHMGKNDNGTVYNKISLIFRNAEKVDEFVERLDARPGGRPGPGDGVHRMYNDSLPSGADDE